MHRISRNRKGHTTLDGVPVYWPKNVDATGCKTFALPGEEYVESTEMRHRTVEYYRQVRGNPAQYARQEQQADQAIQKARDLLSDPEEPAYFREHYNYKD